MEVNDNEINEDSTTLSDKAVFYNIDYSTEGYENNELPVITTDEQLINTPTPKVTHNPLDKKNTKIIIIIIAICLSVMITGVLVGWGVSVSMADLNQKGEMRESQLQSKSNKYQEEYEEMIARFKYTNADKFNYDGVINELYQLKSFKERIEEEDWDNPYFGNESSKKEELINKIDGEYTKLAELVKNYLNSSLDSIQIDSALFDTDGNPIADSLPTIENIQKQINELETLYANILDDQLNYKIYSSNEFSEIIEKYSQLNDSLQKLYQSSLDKVTTEKAVEESNKKFDEQKEELTKQITEELTPKITTEVTEKVTKENSDANNKTINEKDSEISSLKNQLQQKTQQYDELLAKYNALEKQNTSGK